MRLERQIKTDVWESYGFVPDLSRLIHLNDRRALETTPPAAYFHKPYNLAFRDLTSGKSLSAANHRIISLSTKIFPIPKYASPKKQADITFARFQRDILWKVLFAGDDSVYIKSKLYVKSTNQPDLPPLEIDSGLYLFEIELRRLFYNKKGRPNLTSFEQKLLKKLQANDQIVFAHSDKGLGPVAVELERYIKDVLVHLTDSNTYQQIDEPTAMAENDDLRTEINAWISKYYGVLEESHVQYIRKKNERS